MLLRPECYRVIILGVGKFNQANPSDNFYNGDLNDLKSTCVSQISAASVSNSPFAVGHYGSLLVVSTGTQYSFQIVVDSSGEKTYIRHRYINSWTAWKEL